VTCGFVGHTECTAVIQMLAHEIPGILPVNPEGGKIARAAAISPLIEARNVYLPHPLFAPWVNDFIEECGLFECRPRRKTADLERAVDGQASNTDL
jgi:predicted phage terminase large subunit-like protein